MPPVRRVRWQAAHRFVPTRFPPIDLFERVADPADWDAIYALEAMTNPRIRDEIGDIACVPVARRVSGPGASIVMAPFAHASRARPTRFSDGSFGVYYAANGQETALREVAFHMGRFFAATRDPQTTATLRGYAGRLDRALHDLRGSDWTAYLDADVKRYATSQALGRRLRTAGSNGVVYPSVRHASGQCVAAFWPDVVGVPVQASHVTLRWDGSRIDAWRPINGRTWTEFAD